MARSSNRREELDFKIVDFRPVRARGILCVFDVEFPSVGVTICNMYIEFARSGSGFRLGYPSTKRKRLPKDRQDFRLRLTRDKEKEIYDEANFKFGAEMREYMRSGPTAQAVDDDSAPTGLSLPTEAELEEDSHDE